MPGLQYKMGLGVYRRKYGSVCEYMTCVKYCEVEQVLGENTNVFYCYYHWLTGTTFTVM